MNPNIAKFILENEIPTTIYEWNRIADFYRRQDIINAEKKRLADREKMKKENPKDYYLTL